MSFCHYYPFNFNDSKIYPPITHRKLKNNMPVALQTKWCLAQGFQLKRRVARLVPCARRTGKEHL